jgi:hypothetical protein
MRKRKRQLLLLIYVVFLLALFEGTARLFFVIPAISNRLPEDEETTWRHEWIGRHKGGVEIYYRFDIFDPTKGWISKPNLRQMKVFGNKVLNTNSRGLRGEKEYGYGRHPNKTRLLILGDSFTFGDEVGDTETYSSYLQDMIPTAEIINMGVHGYGHDQMLILLKEEGVKYKPDIVILGFMTLDMPRNVLQFGDYAKPRFVLDNAKLTITGSPVPVPEDVLNWDWARPRLYDVWSLLRHKVLVRSGRYEKQMKEVTKGLLDEMLITINKVGAIPVFVYLPDAYDLYNQDELTSGERFLFSYCHEKNEKNTLHCFSSRPHFLEKIQHGVELRTIGHWGPLGHLTVAEAIYEYLAAQNIVSLQFSSNSSIPKPQQIAGTAR